MKSQKEANFSKEVNIISHNQPLLKNINNDNYLLNNREMKLHKDGKDFALDNKKDVTISSTKNNFNNISNNYMDHQQLWNISLNSIDDKYKNLENPFTSPEIPKNADEERRSKIIKRINLNRISKFKSLSVDNIRY